MRLNFDELKESYDSVLESVSRFDSSLYPILCILRALMDTNDSLSDISDRFDELLITVNEIDRNISMLQDELYLLTGKKPGAENIMEDDITF